MRPGTKSFSMFQMKYCSVNLTAFTMVPWWNWGTASDSFCNFNLTIMLTLCSNWLQLFFYSSYNYFCHQYTVPSNMFEAYWEPKCVFRQNARWIIGLVQWHTKSTLRLEWAWIDYLSIYLFMHKLRQRHICVENVSTWAKSSGLSRGSMNLLHKHRDEKKKEGDWMEITKNWSSCWVLRSVRGWI